jgi:hypothetical protein
MARTLVRNALTVLAALTLAACGTATDSDLRLDITPDKPEYTTGSSVVLTIRNLDDDPVGYSFCTWVIERQTLAGWVTVDSQSVACPMAIFRIDPGQSVTGTIVLPNDLPTGRYRVYLPGIGELASDQVITERTAAEKTSTPFQVRALVAVPFN